MITDADDYSDLPPDGIEDTYDIDRYGSAFAWRPKDPYKKLRDDYVKKHPLDFFHGSVFACEEMNEVFTTDEDERGAPVRLFGDLIRTGELTILFADTGLGKSILAVQIADAVTRGQRSPPYEGGVAVTASSAGTDGVVLSQTLTNVLRNDSERIGVLYIDFEMTKAQFAERYSAGVEDGEYIDPYHFENIHRVFIDWQDDLPDGFKNFADFIAHSTFNLVRDKQPGLLIIDNISYFSSSNLGSSQALRVMRALKQIKSEFGCAILVLAHTPKRAIARPLTVNDLAGSKNLANFADNIFAIGRSPHGRDIRYIKTIKVRNNAASYDATNVIVCRLEKPHNFPRFTYTGEAAERLHTSQPFDNANADRAHLITEAHRLSHEGLTQRQIAADLGVSLGTVNHYLSIYLDR